MNDLVIQSREQRSLTVAEIKSGVNLIQAVMRSVMKSGTHFGTIPGCGDKKTLFKPGAEKIMAAFRLVCNPIIDDLSIYPETVRYRISAEIRTSAGDLVGLGVGECSSDEEKYRWRKAIGEEFDEAPEDRRRIKWAGGKSPYQTKQVRTNPADIANTILKMAKKRALIDGVLTATAASDCFTQDIEELPEGFVTEGRSRKPDVEMPRSKDDTISEAQRKRLDLIYQDAGYSEADVLSYLSNNFGLSSTADIPPKDFEAFCQVFSQPKEQPKNDPANKAPKASPLKRKSGKTKTPEQEDGGALLDDPEIQELCAACSMTDDQLAQEIEAVNGDRAKLVERLTAYAKG